VRSRAGEHCARQRHPTFRTEGSAEREHITACRADTPFTREALETTGTPQRYE